MVITVIKRWVGAKTVRMVDTVRTGLEMGYGVVTRGVEDDWFMGVVGRGVEGALERLGRSAAGWGSGHCRAVLDDGR